MSRKVKPRSLIEADRPARIFAALGDDTRLQLVARLTGGEPHSIAQLTSGFDLTRQAVTKHLRVLQTAGLVESGRHGREILFRLAPEPLQQARDYLDEVSQLWSDALTRLKTFVEAEPDQD
jgi:DNA-binding transcriptional ArsR family regulator